MLNEFCLGYQIKTIFFRGSLFSFSWCEKAHQKDPKYPGKLNGLKFNKK